MKKQIMVYGMFSNLLVKSYMFNFMCDVVLYDAEYDCSLEGGKYMYLPVRFNTGGITFRCNNYFDEIIFIIIAHLCSIPAYKYKQSTSTRLSW